MSSLPLSRALTLAVLLCAPVLGVVSESQAQLTRVANTTLNLPADLPAGTFSTTNAFPGISFTDPVAIVTPPGESNRLFVLEKPGRIIVIPDLTNPVKQTFLDISSRTNPGGEEGLLGLAFHPNYNNAGQQGYGEFFVFYQTNAPGQRHFRVSRFDVSAGNPNLADSGSEQPLITQRDQASNHNGGDLHFGDDGYLYISVGDEGGANDTFDNSQHIDKDFFGAIYRIDVDRLPANLTPNNHAAVHAGTYKVPADNPFVGATTFNGSPVTPANVRSEIWAIGMRNPWRMSFDRPTGRLFVADVGQGTREEIDILSPVVFATNGGIPNYGWSYREGFADFNNGPGGATPPAEFTHIDPIHDYPRSQGQSVTGGLVYRGSSYPELTGDYLFSDYASGRVWAMDDPGGPGQTVTQIATEHHVAGFGIHPLTGDVLLADLGNDQVKRLVRTTGAGTQPPQLLSQTAAFSNLANLTPEAGVVPYDINVSFWSDNAIKTRWFSIPNVNDDMTWARDGNWSFPEGQVWIKHFELDLDRDNPGTNVRRLETRFLVKTADDVYGITYRWNDQQTDADLVSENGLAEDFTITEGGGQRVQTWKYPSRNDCRTCHTEVGGLALGFNTRQLNATFDYGAGLENQIQELEDAGYFTNNPPDPGTLPTFFAADDGAASLENRARSFLAANCVQCHQPGGLALGQFDARPEIPLANAGIIDGPLINNDGDPFNRLIVEGSPEHSMILKRLQAVEDESSTLAPMPPLGSCVKNQEAIDLLTDWIDSMKKVLFVRGADRSGGFLEAGNDASRTEHLASIFNDAVNGGNHGWGELATALETEGYLLEELAEPLEAGAPPTGQTTGERLALESINLDQYCAIVLGSNNAVYDAAAINALEAYVRGGGSALFISDANFGGNWADAPNSDQQFLDRFGLIMNQDRGTYTVDRAQGEFTVPDHPIFAGVDTFMGEGVSPGMIPAGSPPAGVTITRLAAASGQTRNNDGTSGNFQGSLRATTASDGSLIVATADLGKVAIHFDRNTFFNLNGAGTDINEHDNEQYAINLFNWLCADPVPPEPVDPPTGVTASDGADEDRVTVAWSPVDGATSYRVFRNTTNNSGTATEIGTPATAAFSDAAAVPGTTYFYWVKSVNAAHESDFSASDSGWRGIAAPPGVSASDEAFLDRIEISWGTVFAGLDYEVFRNTIDDTVTATLRSTTASTAFNDTTPAVGQTYYYWVRARNGARLGAFSASDTGSTRIGAPAGITAANDVSGVRVDWNAVTGATEYRVYRGTNSSAAFSTQIATVPTGTTHTDATGVVGQPYHYFVRAVASGVLGPFSSGAVGQKLHPPPESVAATEGLLDTNVRISWSGVSGTAEYVVFRNTTASEAGALEVARLGPGRRQFDDTTAVPGTEYFYAVRTVMPDGNESVLSDWNRGVRSPVPTFRPDGLIGKSRANRRGDNIYNTNATGQTLSIRNKRRRPVRLYLLLENDGVQADTLTVTGSRGNRKFRVRYDAFPTGGAKQNVSAAVVSGRHAVALAPLGRTELQLELKRKGSRARSFKRYTTIVSAISGRAPERRDTVKGKVRSR